MAPEPRSAYALQFFLLASSLLATAGVSAYLLVNNLPYDPNALPNRFSIAFAFSTCLLFLGSGCLHLAVMAVRRERQQRFRRWLRAALGMGTLFVVSQTYALTCLMRQQPPDEVETGAAAMVAVFGTLHGMHFVIALLFLSHVAVQAFADRYDHEYYFGVMICAWFWHALGIAWLAILGAMFIAKFFYS